MPDVVNQTINKKCFRSLKTKILAIEPNEFESSQHMNYSLFTKRLTHKKIFLSNDSFVHALNSKGRKTSIHPTNIGGID